MPTKPLQQKVTKPKQAGSARSLDRWQRDLEREYDRLRTVLNRLGRLLQSMRGAERR